MPVDAVKPGGSSLANDLAKVKNQSSSINGDAQTSSTQSTGLSPEELVEQQQNLASQGSNWASMLSGGGSSAPASRNDFPGPQKTMQYGNNNQYGFPPNEPMPIDFNGFNPSAFSDSSALSGFVNDYGLSEIMNDPNVPKLAKVAIAFMAEARKKVDRDLEEIVKLQNIGTTGKDGANGATSQSSDEAIAQAHLSSDMRDKSRVDEAGGNILNLVDKNREKTFQNIKG